MRLVVGSLARQPRFCLLRTTPNGSHKSGFTAAPRLTDSWLFWQHATVVPLTPNSSKLSSAHTVILPKCTLNPPFTIPSRPPVTAKCVRLLRHSYINPDRVFRHMVSLESHYGHTKTLDRIACNACRTNRPHDRNPGICVELQPIEPLSPVWVHREWTEWRMC